MSSALPVISQSIPLHIKSQLPQPQTPWNMSSTLFKRVQDKLCEVFSSDSDYAFIHKYFEHQKPAGYGINRIVCIYNPTHTQMFESTLKNIELEAMNSVSQLKGKNEEPQAERARVIQRWEAQVSQFSPVEIETPLNPRKDVCFRAKVLPLWHESSKEVSSSVCTSGFISFGKQHYFNESANQGNNKSTDKDYFGSGIYFTNSARYAAMYSSEGHLLLSWVSMQEPYPVVNDKPHPQKGSDMQKLAGQKHYQNYNAHYIPVASIRPQDPSVLSTIPATKISNLLGMNLSSFIPLKLYLAFGLS